MKDVMRPIPFDQLITRIMEEYKCYHTIFSVDKIYKNPQGQTMDFYGHKLENPLGPAAGPHTQMAHNLVASYAAGGRFFELKTVQTLDGDQLQVAKPCIRADDEAYNVEWSTELFIDQALEEYIKGWFACKVIAQEFGLGDPNAFIFNMSVGYDLAGIQSDKVDRFIEGLKDAGKTPYFAECQSWLLDHLDLFDKVNKEFIERISPDICHSIALSTMHGCPANEIESIVSYLLEEKGLNTYLKCNPTLLGYDFVRQILDDMGYDYIDFGHEGFDNDLQYSTAIRMLKQLQKTALDHGLHFGVKLSNTFQVKVDHQELPGSDMYMSGKALYPLTINLAARLSEDFEGELPISYSGGADSKNIRAIYEAGIWPITVATILLRPDGYNRLNQLAKKLDKCTFTDSKKVDVEKIKALADSARTDKHYGKKKKEPLRSFAGPVNRGVGCRNVCGTCVDVCPNRANILVKIKHHKIMMHIDDYCNDCGNCYISCPDPCRPYKDRFTLFSSLADLADSDNMGFTILENNQVSYRIDRDIIECPLEESPEIVQDFVSAVKEQHPYLLGVRV